MSKDKKTIGEIVDFGKKLVGKISTEEKERLASNPDPREKMTPEEIEEFMRQEEAQLDGMLGKFLSISQPSFIEEQVGGAEEEEEEIVTLDFENNTVTEKIGEGVAVRNQDGSIDLVKDPEVERRVKELIEKNAEPLKPTLQQKYQDMITDRVISKAIGSLIEKFNKAEKEAEENVSNIVGGEIGYALSEKVSLQIYNQKAELRAAIAGGKVYYDKIPDWAKNYIDEYVYDAIGTLIDFVERD